MPNGDVYPCCSPCNIEAFKLGNIHNDLLDQLLLGYKTNLSFFTVLSRGLKRIAEDILKNDLFVLDSLYVDSCDFCRFVFANTERRNSLLNYYKQ